MTSVKFAVIQDRKGPEFMKFKTNFESNVSDFTILSQSCVMNGANINKAGQKKASSFLMCFISLIDRKTGKSLESNYYEYQVG